MAGEGDDFGIRSGFDSPCSPAFPALLSFSTRALNEFTREMHSSRFNLRYSGLCARPAWLDHFFSRDFNAVARDARPVNLFGGAANIVSMAAVPLLWKWQDLPRGNRNALSGSVGFLFFCPAGVVSLEFPAFMVDGRNSLVVLLRRELSGISLCWSDNGLLIIDSLRDVRDGLIVWFELLVFVVEGLFWWTGLSRMTLRWTDLRI